MWIVYVLLSLKDGKRYIGSTNDISRRLKAHNSELVASTKGRRPLELIYSEEYGTEKEARAREKFLKTHKGYNELKNIFNKRGVVYR